LPIITDFFSNQALRQRYENQTPVQPLLPDLLLYNILTADTIACNYGAAVTSGNT
jgi:hypothetical protein